MDYQFPSSFRFGIADADLQVIGEMYTQRYEASQPTMWNHFAKNSGRCFKKQSPDEGVDRYHLWKSDLALLQKLGVQHYRTSVSMSRLLTPEGAVNKRALSWYIEYFKALKKAGIKVYITLYHWELPQALQEQGGWLNKDTIRTFLKHITYVVNYLGEYIEEYFLLNEPRCSSFIGHYYGVHAPGEQNLKHAIQVAHNLLLAQGMAVTTLLELDKNIKISTAVNVGPRYAFSTEAKDIQAAKIVDCLKNRWFLDPLFIGKYPEDLVSLFDNNMPKQYEQDMDIIRVGKYLNSLGLNYYRGDIVKENKNSELGFETVLNSNGETTSLGWGIFLPPHYPEGLYDILHQIYYSYNEFGLKKLYITENGMAENTPWDKQSTLIEDKKRIQFLAEHLKLISKAIKRTIPIEAYFLWTFMDNYEWAEGYQEKAAFGLIHIDRASMKRIPKKSFFWYKDVIKNKKIE